MSGVNRRCYQCGEADFELHVFHDMGVHEGVRCPGCGEYAYGSNAMMATLTGPSGPFDLEALIEDLTGLGGPT